MSFHSSPNPFLSSLDAPLNRETDSPAQEFSRLTFSRRAAHGLLALGAALTGASALEASAFEASTAPPAAESSELISEHFTQVQKRLPLLTLGRHADLNSELSNALQTIDTPQGHQLYKALVELWGLKEVPIDELQYILNDTEAALPEFFLSEKNAQSIQALVKRYNIMAERWKPAAGEERFYPGGLTEIRVYGPTLARQVDFLLQPETEAVLRSCFKESFSSAGEEHVLVFHEANAIAAHKGLLSGRERFSAAVEYLSSEWKLKLYEIIPGLDSELPENILHHLSQPDTKEIHEYLERHRSQRLILCGTTLQKTLELSRHPGALKVLSRLEELGFSSDASELLEFYCLARPDFTADILDPKFKEFLDKTSECFYRGDLGRQIFQADQTSSEAATRLATLLSLSELYSTTRADSKQVERLFCSETQTLLRTLLTRLKTEALPVSGLPVLLEIAHTLGEKPERLTELIDRLEEHCEELSLNDLALINQILKRPDLEQLLFSRDRLEIALLSQYERPAYQRTSRPDDSEFGTYTERPDPSTLSSLQLLRAVLLCEALSTPEVQRQIGALAVGDIADKRTEFGGILRFDRHGLCFDEIPGLPRGDGHYYAPVPDLMINGLADFHLHALEADQSEWSGPSGGIDAGSGDLASARLHASPGVVVTTLGMAGEDRIGVNVDFYYVEGSGEQARARIVDLGRYVVPFGK